MDGESTEMTAWMFCRECKKFDDGGHNDRPCSGKAFDFIVKDDVKFMAECGYEFDEQLIKDAMPEKEFQELYGESQNEAANTDGA